MDPRIEARCNSHLDVSRKSDWQPCGAPGGNVPVVWAIHHNAYDPRVDKRRTMLVNRVCALLSQKYAARIVFCSEASLRTHKKLNYAAEKLEVIPNGFDLEQ